MDSLGSNSREATRVYAISGLEKRHPSDAGGMLTVLLTILGPPEALEAMIAQWRHHYKHNAEMLAKIEEHQRVVAAFAASRAS